MGGETILALLLHKILQISRPAGNFSHVCAKNYSKLGYLHSQQMKLLHSTGGRWTVTKRHSSSKEQPSWWYKTLASSYSICCCPEPTAWVARWGALCNSTLRKEQYAWKIIEKNSGQPWLGNFKVTYTVSMPLARGATGRTFFPQIITEGAM